jgi:hypothetical protein
VSTYSSPSPASSAAAKAHVTKPAPAQSTFESYTPKEAKQQPQQKGKAKANATPTAPPAVEQFSTYQPATKAAAAAPAARTQRPPKLEAEYKPH